jgi:hypothetical protein
MTIKLNEKLMNEYKQFIMQLYELPGSNQTTSWVAKETKTRAISIFSKAPQLVAIHNQQLATEIQKIASFMTALFSLENANLFIKKFPQLPTLHQQSNNAKIQLQQLGEQESVKHPGEIVREARDTLGIILSLQTQKTPEIQNIYAVVNIFCSVLNSNSHSNHLKRKCPPEFNKDIVLRPTKRPRTAL